MKSFQFLALSAVLATGFSFQTVQRSQKAFVPSVSLRPKTCKTFPSENKLDLNQKGGTALWYRPIDEDDEKVAMLQVQQRTPLGYDMKEALEEQKQQQPPSSQGSTAKQSSALNRTLIKALLLNQGIILGAASVLSFVMLLGFGGFAAITDLPNTLNWANGFNDSIITPSWLVGVLGAIPLITAGNWIESSDKRIFANINFSTITMVMTLLGRRTVPPAEFLPAGLPPENIPTTKSLEAFYQSFVLSLVTGLCEETVFRFLVAGVLYNIFGQDFAIAFLGQAALFALGHAQQGGLASAENRVVIGLQLFNGIGFGLIYLLAGGNLFAPIIAHALYDLTTFYKTWADANGQIEYANSMASKPLTKEVNEAMVKEIEKSMDPKLFKTIKRLFFTFDFNKNKTLDISEVRKGISYLALEKAGNPPPQEQVDAMFERVIAARKNPVEGSEDRLSFSDFLLLYSMLVTREVPSGGSNIPINV